MRALGPAWIILAAGSASVAASAPVQVEAVPLDLQIRQARAEAAAAEAEQKRAERAAGEARGQATRLHLEQVAAARAIAAEEARISSADAEAQLLRARLTLQRRQLAEQRAPVSSLLAGLALMGERPALAMLVDAQSATDLIKVKLLLDAITPAIRTKSEAIAAELNASQALQRAVVAARARALQSREELDSRKLHLARLEVRASRLAEQRGGEALGAGDVLIAREEKAAQLERRGSNAPLAIGVARQLARLGPAPLRPGKSTPPPPPLAYRLPASAAVLHGLGSLSEAGVRSRGLTLATRRGEPVAAPAAGAILFSGPFGDYDGVVIIDHGAGWRSVLVNVGSVAAKGSRIAAGQPLGTAFGPIEVQLQQEGRAVSPALIAGSSALLSNDRKSE